MKSYPKACTHGTPGERARFTGLVYALWPLLVALFAAGLVMGLLLPVRPVPVVGGGFALVTLALVLLVSVAVCPVRVMAFFKGARGEERVAALLNSLPAGYHVFHGLAGATPLSVRDDIDHAVIGPSGLFVIETKCWQGCVTCRDGHVRLDGRLPRRDPVAQVRQSSRRLGEWLAAGLEHVPEIRPVVCFAGRGLAEGRSRFDEVVLCDADDLLDVVTAPSAVLTNDDVTRVAGLLEQRV